jgi:hypothetical protein
MSSHAVNRERRKSVEDELRRRGAVDITSRRRDHILYLYASKADHSRTVELRVLTKQPKKNWQPHASNGRLLDTPPLQEEEDTNFGC